MGDKVKRMWRWICGVLAAVMALGCWECAAVTNVVCLDLHDYASMQVTNRRVLFTPVSLEARPGAVASYERGIRTSDASGLIWITNMAAGTHQAELLSPPSGGGKFMFYIDGTNSLFFVGSNLVASATATWPAGSVAWSASASDLRYVRAGTVVAANVVWPVAGAGVTIETNGYAAVISAVGGGGSSNAVAVAAGPQISVQTNGNLATIGAPTLASTGYVQTAMAPYALQSAVDPKADTNWVKAAISSSNAPMASTAHVAQAIAPYADTNLVNTTSNGLRAQIGAQVAGVNSWMGQQGDVNMTRDQVMGVLVSPYTTNSRPGILGPLNYNLGGMSNASLPLATGYLASASLRLGQSTPYDFGAVGDGSTDDTAAMQSWINTCQWSNWTAVLPPARAGAYYKITSPLWVTNSGGLKIDGSGGQNLSSGSDPTTVRIHQATAGQCGIIVSNWNGSTPTDNVIFKDFLVTAATYNASSSGILFAGGTPDSDACEMSGVGVQGFGYGLNVIGASVFRAESCTFGLNGDGIHINGPIVNSVVFQGCSVGYNYSNGLYVVGASVLWNNGDLGDDPVGLNGHNLWVGNSAAVTMLVPNMEHFGTGAAIVLDGGGVNSFFGRIVKMGGAAAGSVAIASTNGAATIFRTYINCADTSGNTVIDHDIGMDIRSVDPLPVLQTVGGVYTNWVSDLRISDVPAFTGGVSQGDGQIKLTRRNGGVAQDGLLARVHMNGKWSGSTALQQVDLLDYAGDKSNTIPANNLYVAGTITGAGTNAIVQYGTNAAKTYSDNQRVASTNLAALQGMGLFVTNGAHWFDPESQYFSIGSGALSVIGGDGDLQTSGALYVGGTLYMAGGVTVKTYVAGTGITMTTNSNEVTINSTATGGGGGGTNSATTVLTISGGAVATDMTCPAGVSTNSSRTFRISASGDFTLSNPSGVSAANDGVMATWEVIQDATGSRLITMGNKFAFGSDITGITLTTTANKRDFIRAQYNATADLWYVVGFVRGY